MLTDAGDTLLGWTEFLPPDNLLPAQLPPYCARKTPKRSRFHLGRFTKPSVVPRRVPLDVLVRVVRVLWPAASGLPTFDEIFERVSSEVFRTAAVTPRIRRSICKKSFRRKRSSRTSGGSRNSARHFPRSVRALANIPSYMIFDDHEVTDNWNLTRDFCRDFYGNRSDSESPKTHSSRTPFANTGATYPSNSPSPPRPAPA